MYKSNKPYNITNKLKSRREIFDGIEPKFWIVIDGVDYLYKYNPDFVDVTFGEVFVSALCKALGIKCVDSTFACGTVRGDETKGCLVKSYIEKDIYETIPLMRVTNKLNDAWDTIDDDYMKECTPQNILEDLQNYLKDKNCDIDESVLQDLKVMALFDYVTAQVDRHEKNVEFLVTKHDGQLCLRLAPMFDNGRCFGFASSKALDANRKTENFVTGQRAVLVMDQNLCKNDDSVCGCDYGIAKELFHNPELNALFQKMAKFDIRRFLHDFMEETGERISVLREAQVVETWAHKIEKIKHAMEQYKSPEIRDQIKIEIERNRRAEYIHKNSLYQTDFYINFYYDKLNKKCKNPLSDYLKQDEDYRMQLKKWENLESDDLKTLDSFSLLKPRCDRDSKYKYQEKIIEEQFKRKCEIKKYKQSELFIDYFALECLQRLRDKQLGKLFKSDNEIIDEISQDRRDFAERLRDWVTYGDDLLTKPTLADFGIDRAKKYDDVVVEKYIFDFEIEGRQSNKKYEEWIKMNNKTDLVNKIRNDLAKGL